MKTYQHPASRLLMTIALVLAIGIGMPVSAYANNPVLISPDDQEEGVDSGKKPKHRSPAYGAGITAYYEDGVLSCTAWADDDSMLTITISGESGNDLFCGSFTGAEFAAGIRIGVRDAFTVVITTSGGDSYSGCY